MSEFGESEYRGPLYIHLERGSHLLWESGQVFEKSIGVGQSFTTSLLSWCLNILEEDIFITYGGNKNSSPIRTN